MHDATSSRRPRLLFVVNDAAFFVSHRMPIAFAARTAGYDVHIATPKTEAVDRITEAGFTYHPLRLSRRGMHPLEEVQSITGLYHLFKHTSPDVVHLVAIKPVLYGGIAARLAGVPGVVAAVPGLGSIFTTHGAKAAVARRIITRLYRISFGSARLHAIFQNRSDRETLLRATRLPADRSTMIPGSGVDLSTHTVRPTRSGVPVVFMAARLLRDKGIYEFMEAARLLRGRGVVAEFVVAGDPDYGNPSAVSSEQVDAWRREGLVKMLGHRTDVADLLADAAVVVLPSYREGLPKFLIEAAACGRPVVTTNVPGCRDAIIPGETGLLVPPADAVALADALEALLANPARRAAMGRAGRALAEQQFSIDHVIATHLAIYERLLENAHGSAAR